MCNATDCPTAGILRATSGGRTSEIRFLPQGGLSIDYDSDGQLDLVTSNCRDAAIAECIL